MMIERMKWYFKQLLPLTYRSYYRDKENKQHFVVWNMFLGRCYQVDDVIIDDDPAIYTQDMVA